MSDPRRFAVSGVGVLLIALAFAFPLLAGQGSVSSSGKALAVVDGTTITEEQVNKEATADLEKLEMQQLQFQAEYRRSRHQLLEANLNRLVETKLIETEAAAQGLSRDALLDKEVTSKIQQPSQEDVDKFYEDNKAQIPMPKAEVVGQIVEYLTEQRGRATYDSYVKGLKEKYKVQMFLEPQRVSVDTKDHPSKGPQQAPVTIVLFSDFECPFCSRLTATMRDIEKNYGEKLRVVYRQFPLANHPHAAKAAEASLCANEQSHFWEMHDLLFQEPKKLEVADMKAMAASLKLNAENFDACLDSGRYEERVKRDIRDGSTAGVSGTPAMFVNGRFISGAVPYEELAKVLDDEIAHAPKP